MKKLVLTSLCMALSLTFAAAQSQAAGVPPGLSGRPAPDGRAGGARDPRGYYGGPYSDAEYSQSSGRRCHLELRDIEYANDHLISRPTRVCD